VGQENAELEIIFHPKYLDYRLGPEHPFWPERAKVFLDLLKEREVPHEILKPQRAGDEDVLLAHTPAYLEDAKRLAKERGLLSFDTPVNEKALEAAYYSIGGTYLAFREALAGKRVLNLLGGFHHAGPSAGSGFCIFNDHAIGIRKLQKEGLIKQAMIYDLDGHAGNGTEEIFYSDPTVFAISLHQDPRTLYPGIGFAWQKGVGPGKGYHLNVPLPPGTGEEEYLDRLDEVLKLTKTYEHDLLILVLGVDTFKEDPLVQLSLEEGSYVKIGKRFKKFPKVAVLLAGGYSKMVPQLWLSFIKGFQVEGR